MDMPTRMPTRLPCIILSCPRRTSHASGHACALARAYALDNAQSLAPKPTRKWVLTIMLMRVHHVSSGTPTHQPLAGNLSSSLATTTLTTSSLFNKGVCVPGIAVLSMSEGMLGAASEVARWESGLDN